MQWWLLAGWGAESPGPAAPAGLHEGLRTLTEGGVPPRFLIIDDGWQCTDVDAPLRKPMTSKLLMSPEMRESMAQTEDEFIEAEYQMLNMIARSLPPSSSAGEPQG